MSEIPLYLDDTSSMTVLELRNKARRAAHDHDIGLIIVDYLQLISGSDRYAGNRVQEVLKSPVVSKLSRVNWNSSHRFGSAFSWRHRP